MDLALLVDWLIRVLMALIVLYRNRSTTAVRLGWLVVVLALPFLGVLLYLWFGEIWRGRGYLKRYLQWRRRVSACLPPPNNTDLPITELSRALPAWEPGESELGLFPLRPGNLWQLFSASDQSIQQLRRDIASSQASCHLLFYIWLEDRSGRQIADALIDAAGRDVACRVLVDAVGSREFLRSGLCRSMLSAGVDVKPALPTSTYIRPDHRNHRKLAVIDGQIGWTGSQNLADASFHIKSDYAPWVDVMLRLQGPVAVDLQALFLQDWLTASSEQFDWQDLLAEAPPEMEGGVSVQLYATGPELDVKILRQITVAALFIAKQELVITTPYFVPDETAVTALCARARAGVITTLVLPKHNDSRLVGAASRSFYQDLLEAGVQIYEFRGGLLHAKTTTIDRHFAAIDTANFDRRSFELNFEMGVVVPEPSVAQTLYEIQQRYIDRSDLVTLEQWSLRPRYRVLLENSARLLAPIL